MNSFFFSFFQEILTSGHNVTQCFLCWLKDHDIILADIAVRWKFSILFRVKLEASRVKRISNFFAGHGTFGWSYLITTFSRSSLDPTGIQRDAIPSRERLTWLASDCWLLNKGNESNNSEYRLLHYTHIKLPYMYIYTQKRLSWASWVIPYSAPSLFSWKKTWWFLGLDSALPLTFEPPHEEYIFGCFHK